MSASLTQLLFVQSRLAEEATCFLDRIAKAVDTTPWEFGGKPLLASSAFVEPVLFTEREPGARATMDQSARLPKAAGRSPRPTHCY